MDANDAAFNILEHGTNFAGKKTVQCKYCGAVMSRFFRLKYHLGGIFGDGDVKPCEKVPEKVMEQARKNLLETKRESLSKEVVELDPPDLPHKKSRGSSLDDVKDFKCESTQSPGCASGSHSEMESEIEESVTQSVSLPHKRVGWQKCIDAEKRKDSSSWQVQKCIGRFFFEMGIDFSAANSSSFQSMVNAISHQGKVKYEIPSCEELKGWILQEEVMEMREYVKRIRNSWTSTGCSILLDGWINEIGRNLVSVIVDCPQGPIYLRSFDVSDAVGDVNALLLLLDGVIEEVGVNNVVQIIASSTAGWMDDVGKQFIERRGAVFWSMSASHCIELMLEKIGLMDCVREIIDKAKSITRFIHGHATALKLLRDHTGGRDLIKPSKVRSTMPYMTLDNIVSRKANLKAMFASSEWKTSNCASTTHGKRVVNLVEDSSFWTGARMVLKATIPLVRVLCLIHGADKPNVGYIYETMDQAKETIKEEFKNKKSEYAPFWKIIDDIWNKQLHSPLHAAGYYLNPSLFYSSDFYCDPEVSYGLLICIVRMVQDKRTEELLTVQLDYYRHGKGAFSKGSAIDQRNKYPPAVWWSHYGGECPELQSFAIKILSQTCDGSSKYGLKRSLCEKLLTKGRNFIEQQRLTDLTFVHYNLHLQNSQHVGKTDIVAHEIDSMDDWVVDDTAEMVSENGDSEWMELGGNVLCRCD